MAEINRVIRGIEDQLMHAYDIAFTERRDLDFAAGSFLQNLLHDSRGAGGCILFPRVVALVNLCAILMSESRRCGPHQFKKQIYADGKIRTVQKASTMLFDFGADLG